MKSVFFYLGCNVDHNVIVNLCKKNCSVYIKCKGDIVVVDIKQQEI